MLESATCTDGCASLVIKPIMLPSYVSSCSMLFKMPLASLLNPCSDPVILLPGTDLPELATTLYPHFHSD